MSYLECKQAIVCGGTRGIGRACAHALAEAGACITVIARDERALREVTQSLPTASGGAHRWISVDFSEPYQLRDRIRKHVEEHGPVEILINNTGGPAPGKIIDASIEDFLRALTMHLLCNHLLVQTVLPGMRERSYGRIINIISTSVRQPIPGLGVSNTVRAAVAAWAKTLSGELAPDGVTVNNVLPGYTDTDRLRALISRRAQVNASSLDEVQSQMRSDIPLGRFAEPEEIAAAVAFLASPAASYITGVSLPVDGGRITAI